MADDEQAEATAFVAVTQAKARVKTLEQR